MKRIKIILESKCILILVILFSLLFCLINLNKDTYYEVEDSYIVKSIKYSSDKVSIMTDHVLINYYDDIDIKVGDRIKIEGTYDVPSSNTNFNMLNYNLYLKSKKIYYVNKASKIEIISHSNNILYKIKNKIIERIDKYNEKEYLYAFILGDNNYIDDEVKSSFQSNGISHLFCVSGMHVTLLSMVILTILNKFRKTDLNYIVVILFLLFYSFLVNYTPSIMRSSLFFILLYINKVTNLNINTSKLFIYLTCMFIIYNPFYIYNVGFLFSFSITYFLILFGKNNYNYFVKLLITSLIAFISSIPILINNFYEINLLSPIINLIFVPYVSFTLFPLALISFFIRPLNILLCFLLNILEWLSLFISKFSFNLVLCHIPIYIVIIYYIVIYITLYSIKHGRYRFVLLLITMLFIHTNVINLDNEIHFLNVGQGDSILLRVKNKNYLIDTGGNRNYDLSINLLIPYFKSIGIKKIDHILLTHGDYDHMGSSFELVNNFKVKEVVFNCGEYNELEMELIKLLDEKNIKYSKCIDKLDTLKFLNTKIYDDENDNSNVIYTEIKGYKFLFMGDASISTEKEILSRYNLSNIDVLKVGHHGSKTSSSKFFIDKIKPIYSIISVGKNNRYGHPNKEVLENLKDSKIYRTDEDGEIIFKIKNNELQIKKLVY